MPQGSPTDASSVLPQTAPTDIPLGKKNRANICDALTSTLPAPKHRHIALFHGVLS